MPEDYDEEDAAKGGAVCLIIIIFSLAILAIKYPFLGSAILVIVIVMSAVLYVYARRRKKAETLEELDELRDFIFEGSDSSEVGGKEYVELFWEAKNLIEDGEFDSAKEKIEESRRLKKQEKKREKRVKKRLEKLEDEIDLDKVESSLQEKHNRIGQEIQDENYDKADELLTEIWRAQGYEEFEGEWLKPEKIKEIKSTKAGLDNNFQDYSPYEFEKFIAELFKEMGYKTEVTKKSGDFGIDVIARKSDKTIGIQVKKYKETNLVGTQDVQNTLGSRYKINADQTILITTSRFTVSAEEQAKSGPIELWDKRKLHEMVKKYLIETDLSFEENERDKPWWRKRSP